MPPNSDRDALSSSASESCLLPLTLALEDDDDDEQRTRGSSTTDVETIKDMAKLCEDVGAFPITANARATIKNASAPSGDGNSNGGFFVDSSDRSNDDEDQLLRLSSSPDSVMCVLGETQSSSDGDVQRAMSRMKIGLPFSEHQGDIPVISEEGQPNGVTAIKSADVGPSDNRRLSSRSSSSSSSASPKPLRSSFKGSSSNLRSSLKSISSDHMDVSAHSIESAKMMKRNVSFSSLEIRCYNVTLGDAPTSSGPPVSLDWEYDPVATEEHEINCYEAFRDFRRRKHELIMPPAHRQDLLMRDAGFSRGQIKCATEEARRVARQRARTAKCARYGLQHVEEALEGTRRRFSFSRRKSR